VAVEVFGIVFMIVCRFSVYWAGTEKIHMINFKDLTGRDSRRTVDLGIEVKDN
jgi:hypothetical protein